MHFSVLYITFLLFYVYCPALEESLTSCVTFTTAAPCANTPARGCYTPATHEAELSMLFLKCGAFWSAHEGWEPGFMASLETPNDLLFCTNRRIDRCLTTDRCFTYESLSDGTLISGDGQFHSITNGFCSFQMLRSVAILRLWIRSAMNSFVLSTIS